MPNYGISELDIIGDGNAIKAFWEPVATATVGLDNTPSILKAHYPIPEGMGDKDAFAWACEHWGTGFYDQQHSLMNYNPSFGVMSVSFLNIWEAPCLAFEHISTLFPTLLFELRYINQGGDGGEQIVYKNGEVLERWELTEDEFGDP